MRDYKETHFILRIVSESVDLYDLCISVHPIAIAMSDAVSARVAMLLMGVTPDIGADESITRC